MPNRKGKDGSSDRFLFLGSNITADGDCSHEIRILLLLGRKAIVKPRQCVEKQGYYSANRSPCSQGYGLPSGQVWLWKLDRKEGRMPKNLCLWTVVLEKTPGSSLDIEEIKPVNLKVDQSWLFTGKTDANAEASVFYSSDAHRRLIGKVPDARKDRGQKETRASEDDMVGWHHRCSEHELGKTSGDGERQGGLACCSSWGHKESDMSGQLSNNQKSRAWFKSLTGLGCVTWGDCCVLCACPRSGTLLCAVCICSLPAVQWGVGKPVVELPGSGSHDSEMAALV